MISVQIDYLEGELQTIDSKSILHRYLILAAFSEQKTYIQTTLNSQDIKATCQVLTSMGANIEFDQTGYIVQGPIVQPTNAIKSANCYDSGSTLRFLIPFAFLLDKPITFIGSEQLARRSIDSYLDIFKTYDIQYDYQLTPMSLTIQGKLEAQALKIDSSHSSQFVSGLLMFMAFSDTMKSLEITGNSVSMPYIMLTIATLADFGIHIEVNENIYTIANKTEAKTTLQVEKDYSQAAFFLVANKIDNEVELSNLSLDSIQADAQIIDILESIDDELIGDYTYDINNCPDLGPILMVLGSAIQGSLSLLNTHRLIDKESNRLEIMLQNLDKMRVKYVLKDNSVTIFGQHLRYPGDFEVTTANDHRIIMAMTIASSICRGPVHFESVQGIEKSYPNFFNHIKQLGGEVCQHSE